MSERAESEMVAVLSIDGNSAAYCLDDETQVAGLLQEVRDLIDGSYLPGDTDDDDAKPWVTIGVLRKPKGWVAALPEFEGW